MWRKQQHSANQGWTVPGTANASSEECAAAMMLPRVQKAAARKALRMRVDNNGAKRRRDNNMTAGAPSPFGAGSCDCGGMPEPEPEPAKRQRVLGAAPAWGGGSGGGSGGGAHSPCSSGGGLGGWFAPADSSCDGMLDPSALNLAPYEAAAASLVIRDKVFWRLRWAVGQMAGHHRSQGGDQQQLLSQQLGGYSPAVPAAQLVDLLREGWGGVLMTASQARQLQEVLAFDGASEPRPVDTDVHYALCCRVVDWWNLPLSYTECHGQLDSGATAAVEAYTVGRRLPASPETKALVAEMAEQSASVERQLAKGAQPAPWSWNAAPPAPPLRQLGLGEASAALESAAQAACLSQVAASSSGGDGGGTDEEHPMVMWQGSDMEM